MRRILSKLAFSPLLALVALAVGVVQPGAVALAQTAPAEVLGPPGVYLSTAVPGATVDKGKQVTFSIDVNNNDKVGRTVDLALTSSPEGWNPILKARGFVVRSVWVAPLKPESVDLQMTVPAEAKSQDYTLALKGSGDGFGATTLNLLIGVKDATTKATSLVVQYPSLRGKSGATFGFKADLKNDAEADRSFGLSFKGPDGWDLTFKPSYEDKQISNVQVKTGATQSLDITVTPPSRVVAGEYPITVTAASANDRANTDLNVVITGSYTMTMTTRGDLFNTSATSGQDSPFYVTVTNTGTAPLQNVSLSSSKPDQWAVTFKPDKIDNLDPSAQQEIAVTIKPSAKAIAGDYMMTVTASHPQVSLDRDLRVTVETPTVWGWVGVAVLALVIGGLLGLFMKLGRR